MRAYRDRGLTFVELLLAVSVFAVVSIALLSHVSLFFKETATTRERVFAFKKANAILAELQAYVDRGEVAAAIDLDALDDGVGFNPVLTISQEGGSPVAANHPLSGNAQRSGQWIWSRRITVRPFQGQNNRNVRYVTVRIFHLELNGSRQEMAVISSVINSAASSYPSSQVYDVYFLALENVPGWWVYMDAIRPFMEATVSDLEARNPGLRLRTHWITRSGFGRNPRYTPYVNEANDSTAPVPYAYFYPGRMPTGSSSSFYYVPENIGARINLDGTVINTAAAPPANPARTGAYCEYSLADHFNQTMRYYDELDLFDRRAAAGDEDPLCPTWRILLEQMNSRPERFHNAILVNLHGELLPMPAMRNYADPAKDIANNPYIRAVTHPEKLCALRNAALPASSEDIRLRVHGFLSDPNQAISSVACITLDLLCNTLDADGNLLPVDYNAPGTLGFNFQTQPSVGSSMWASISYISAASASNPHGVGFTRIRLYGTPVKHTQAAAGQVGLPADCRLYGLEYVPCPMATGGAFRNLSSTVDGPKNTARWIITLPHVSLPKDGSGQPQDVVIKAITHIGDAGSVDPAWQAEALKENRSVTYAWFASSPEVVPATERYQFIGDPRHCPYADNMHGGSAPLANGYNAYFDEFVDAYDARARWLASSTGQFNTSNANGWPYLRSRWQGRVELDVPRYTQLLRQALARSEAIYTTLTGFSYYYMGIGNEIGYDSSNGYASSIPVNGSPWGTATGTIYVDNISSGGNVTYRNGKLLRNTTAVATERWWGIHWIGELYPDSVWDNAAAWAGGSGAEWQLSGNLPTRTHGFTSERTFMRARRQDINWNRPAGTTFEETVRRTQEEGSTSVFLCGNVSTATFHHQFADGQSGSLVDAGPELAANYGFPLPGTTRISRPFGVAVSTAGGTPAEWSHTNAFPHFSASILRRYYNHTNGNHGSALVRQIAPTSVADPQRGAFMVVNGLDRTVESGSAFIAKFAVVSLIHSFFEAGNAASGPRITQLPRVQLLSPSEVTELKDPASIDVNIAIEWRRWDGRAYTATTAGAFAEDETNLVYVLSYSGDGGTTWKHVQDDSPALPGLLPSASGLVIADGAPGNETYAWAVPSASFPEGSYLLRVECFRASEALHYATHMVKFYIDR